MSAQWQYMTATCSTIATKKTRLKLSDRDPDPARALFHPPKPPESESYWLQENKLFIYRPGSTRAEELILWSSEGGEKNSLVDIYNKLGAEGWEMVSVTPSAMTMEEVNGYKNSSRTLVVIFWFKRLI
jgi:hypothetical protein